MYLILEWVHQLISVNTNLSCHHLLHLQHNSLNPAKHKPKYSKKSLRLRVQLIKQGEIIAIIVVSTMLGIWVKEVTAATVALSNKVTLRYGNQNKQRKRIVKTNRNTNNKKILNTIKMIYHRLSQETGAWRIIPMKRFSNSRRYLTQKDKADRLKWVTNPIVQCHLHNLPAT